MTNYINIFFALVFLSGTNLYSQSPNWLWAKSFSGIGDDGSFSIKLDANGNIYSTGSFYDTVDFDPGPVNYSLTSAGYTDIFISKLDPSGNFIWAKRIGGTSFENGSSIAIDEANNLYITGSFQGTVDFDPDTGIFILSSSLPQDPDIFISQYDSSGKFVWAAAIGGWHEDYGYSIALDTASNVYTTGLFSGTADFDPDSLGSFSMTAGITDIFISKLDSSGKFLWAKQFSGGDNDYGISIAVDDSGNCFTTGYFEDTVDFDPGPGIFNLTSNGLYDFYISKLDSSGNFKWACSFGNNNKDLGYSVSVDDSGNVYTAGYFDGFVDFDPGPGVFTMYANNGNAFITKLNGAGNFLWAVKFAVGCKAAVDESGYIYAFGSFYYTTDLDPGPGVFNLTSVGYDDIYISKFNGSGDFLWAQSAGGIDFDWISSLAFDAAEDIYVTGGFSGMDISFGTSMLTNSSAGHGDIYIAKLENIITGINEVENKNGILIYPNPVTNHFTIAFADKYKNIEIIIKDMTGKTVYTSFEKELKYSEVNIRGFSDGVYLLQIQTDDFIETKKIIVSR